jgi:hypothetical protein
MRNQRSPAALFDQRLTNVPTPGAGGGEMSLTATQPMGGAIAIPAEFHAVFAAQQAAHRRQMNPALEERRADLRADLRALQRLAEPDPRLHAADEELNHAQCSPQDSRRGMRPTHESGAATRRDRVDERTHGV